MVITPSRIPEVKILEPRLFGDERGFFTETWNENEFNRAIGSRVQFVQDNHSRSTKGVLRGLHYQLIQPQGKLVRVVNGSVFDVAVDLRKGSATFGHHVGIMLTSENKRQLWVPPGFAHGFLVMSESADFLYKTTDYYHPESERTLLWNDSELQIDWPLQDLGSEPQLSTKDKSGLPLSKSETFV